LWDITYNLSPKGIDKLKEVKEQNDWFLYSEDYIDDKQHGRRPWRYTKQRIRNVEEEFEYLPAICV